ncbi:MAG: LptF/LptG family permease [Thermodesulfobacteriota bacterium]
MKQSFRPPFLLYSYLVTEMLGPFFASFVIMNAVFFLVRLIPFLNVVLDLNIGPADFVRLFSYLFPNMFLYSIPMAGMLAVIVGFTRLSADTEILALKASGVSIYQTLPPVMIFGIIISLVTGYFSIKLIPVGEIAMKQLMFQVAKEKIDKGIKEHQFTDALGDVVVYVNRIDKETGRWKDVWVSDKRGHYYPTITMAHEGVMRTDLAAMSVTIILKEGTLHRPGKKGSQVVSFDRYQINIPLQVPTVIGKENVAARSSSTLSMAELKASAEEIGPSTPRGRYRLVQYYKRLVLPVGCFILTLLGLPLGLQSGPGRKAAGLPLGLGFFILYYVGYTLGKTVAEDSNLPVIIPIWAPNLIFLIGAIILIHRVAREKPLFPKPVIEKLLDLRDHFLAPVWNWIKGKKRRKKA